MEYDREDVARLEEARNGEGLIAIIEDIDDERSMARADTRCAAIKALTSVLGEGAVPVLLACLQNQDEVNVVRSVAATSLGPLGSDTTESNPIESALLGIAADPKEDGLVRDWALETLALHLPSDRTVTLFAELLEDPGSGMHVATGRALTKLIDGGASVTDPERMIDALLEVIEVDRHHPNPWTRAEAIAALGRLGGSRALAAIRAGLEDSSELVRNAAAVALDRLPGQDERPER